MVEVVSLLERCPHFRGCMSHRQSSYTLSLAPSQPSQQGGSNLDEAIYVMKGHADHEEAMYRKGHSGDCMEQTGMGSPGLAIPPEDITERIPVSRGLMYMYFQERRESCYIENIMCYGPCRPRGALNFTQFMNILLPCPL